METVTVTPTLTMLRVKGWQVYVWRDGESVTLIDTGRRDRAPRSPRPCPESDPDGVDARPRRPPDRPPNFENQPERRYWQAQVMPPHRGETDMAPPVFEDWEVPIYQRVSAGLPA